MLDIAGKEIRWQAGSEIKVIQLYSYWRSSTSYRARIALQLKGIEHKIVPVDLLKGEQRSASYSLLNPSRGVPCLSLEDGRSLTQSMAILRYLDQIVPAPPLLPDDPFEAAKVNAAAMIIASDIHPINNLKVIGRLKAMGHGQDETVAWMNHWMREGLRAFNSLIGDGPFCFGSEPTIADICLIPQLYNAHRWSTDLAGLDRLLDIERNCLSLAPFNRARPEVQPNAK